MNNRKKVNIIIIFLLLMNIILTAIKLFGGIKGNSLSLRSDGLNSLGDVLTSVLLLFIIQVSNRKADKNHPYGHQKYEGIMHFIIGIVVLSTAGIIIKSAVDNLVYYFKDSGSLDEPDVLTVIIASISIFVKLLMVYLSRLGFKKYDSVALKGAFIDYLTDAIITTVGLIGILVARAGFIYFDSIASLVIALIVLKAAFDIIKESVSFLVDQAPDEKTVNMVKDFIMSLDGVMDIDDLKVVKHMNRLYVDVEISVLAALSLIESHRIAESVHEGVENHFNEVIHCMVHVNPHIEQNL